MSVRLVDHSRPPAVLEQSGAGTTVLLLVLLFALAGILAATL